MGLLLAGTVMMLCATGPASAAGASPVTVDQAAGLGQQAYLYGFPLLEFLRVRRTATSVRCPDARGDAPVNSFSTATRFSDPSERTIVAPNVDTLYSIAHLDLGRGPVVLSHPSMGQRYFVFQLLDPYTNVIGYVGTRTTGSRAGRFAIEWTAHPGRRVNRARLIRSAYRRVWIIGRTLARDGPDRRRAVALMRQYRLAPPGGVRQFSTACHPGRPHKAATPAGLAFLDALGQALEANPPPARDRTVLDQLATVGVGPGLRPERAGLPPAILSALVDRVNATASALPGAVRSSIVSKAAAHGGWAVPASDIGDYGTDYTYRAGVAQAGLGANTPAEAVYPTAYTDSTGQPLTGRKSYRIVFPRGQLPPARAFWSLTLYDNMGFLVPSAVHRYAIGDTHPPLFKQPNGSIVVLVQRARPAQARVNWVPAPAGQFRLALRLYWPTAAVLSGRWQPPPIQPIGGGASQ